MAISSDLFQAVRDLVVACTKHVSRATRKIRDQSRLSKLAPTRRRAVSSAALGQGTCVISFFGAKKKIAGGKDAAEAEVEVDAEDGVWRRAILMGEKCQPLEFSGAIYYDSQGRQLTEVPTPRPPLPSYSFHSTLGN